MKHKIYFGEVDIKDTRTGKITTVQRIIYKKDQPLNELHGRVMKSIPRSDREYYKIMSPDPARAKVIGETA